MVRYNKRVGVKMKKYINFLNLIEVVLYLVIVSILFSVEGEPNYSLYFTMIYWGTFFVINLGYYTLDFIKNKRTPKISIYSPTALFAYFLSCFGMAFVKIKNHSYREFIKSANDYQNMTEKQRIQSYLYYFLVWVVILMLLLFTYLDDLGEQQLGGIILLFALLTLIYRVFMLYGFAGKKEGKNNE